MKKICLKRNLLITFIVLSVMLISIVGVIGSKPLNASAAAIDTASAYSSNSPYLQLELVGEGSDYYLIRVTNTTSQSIEVIYNEFMCYGDDAKNWEALGHLKTINLGTSDNTSSAFSKTKDIKVYNFPLTTGYITFSYISGDQRLITYADHLDGANLSLTTYTNSVTVYSECLEILTTAYNGGVWTVRVTNPNGYSVKLEYNLKMCFENDAKNWSLSDPGEEETISAYGSTTVKVIENWFATTIAFSYLRNGKRYITYAYDLNKFVPSIMTIKTVIK